ncbi:MAG: HAD-IIIA family hydrolase [Flavobacteriaceae bacterium]|nr:HAD-IIIA family hydrolase [Bacteroidia bacterium]NNK81713.1 HAD-IIIA family hydrolase [Flavobacteriaceae bacterium]
MANKNYKEYLNDISTFILDVDGVLTNGDIIVTTEGEQYRTMNTKDGYAITSALKAGYNICIISGGSNEGVKKRLEKLGVKDVFLGTHEKVSFLKEYMAKNNLSPDELIYVGDDLPDYNVMQMVALPCCPQDAVPEIKAISKYISHKNGGRGVVRDVIEQVMKAQGKWMKNFNALYD